MAATTIPFPASAWAMKRESPRLRPRPWWKTTSGQPPVGGVPAGMAMMVGRGTKAPAAGIGLKAPVAGSSLSKVMTFASTKVEMPAASELGRDAPLRRHGGRRHRLGLSGSDGSAGLK